MSSLLIKNIGEFFTGDIASPLASVGSLLVRDGRIVAFDPPDSTSADRVLDAGGSAVMPGLVDGHVHPVFGEWTPTQDTQGWIGNYVHGGTTTMVSACELHVPGLDYDNLTPELVTSLAVVTASTTGRVRWSGAKVHAGTVILVPGMTEQHFDRLAAVHSILAGDIVIVADSRTAAGTQAVYGGDYASGSLYAQRAFVQKNPHIVQAITNAMVRGLAWIKSATPEQIMAALPADFYQGNPQLYRQSLLNNIESFSPDGRMPAEAPDVVYRAVTRFDPALASGKIDVRATYDNAYVERAHRSK